MNVNQAWLSKSIGKYYSWLWYHSKNIEFITRGLLPLVINSIFFLVITITTRNIFQYFLTAMHDSFILILTLINLQKLVCKVDQLVKRRAKSGLIRVKVDWNSAKEFVTEHLDKEIKV